MPPDEPSLPLTEAAWLDVHFTAMRPEYERMLRSVGIRPGWRVVDAGCGTGPFLPLLRELVGDRGTVLAIDRDSTAVAGLGRRAIDSGWTNVRVQSGDVCRLDAEAAGLAPFDAIWCANVTQYLDDASLDRFVRAARLVLRPGGLLAIKEFEGDALSIEPLSAGLLARWHDARCAAGSAHALALRRTASLGTRLSGAGFADVRATPTAMERCAPLDPATGELVRSLFRFLAAEAAKVCLTAEDQAEWSALADPNALAHPLRRSDFRYRAVQWTVVGTA